MYKRQEEITLHKAAKAAFDEAGLQKLPKVKELDAEFAELLTKKKAAYPYLAAASSRHIFDRRSGAAYI